MKRKLFPLLSLRRNPFLAVFSTILILCSTFFCSCKEKKNETAAAGPSCVTLTNAQIQNTWVGQSFTDPKSKNLIKWVRILTSWNGDPKGKFEISVTGIRADYSEIAGSIINLKAGMDCAVALPANIAIGKNNILLSDLQILEPDGKLKSDFNYIKFTPTTKTVNAVEFLTYTSDVFAGGVETNRGGSLPCPPCDYCLPPCVKQPADSIPPPPDTLMNKAANNN